MLRIRTCKHSPSCSLLSCSCSLLFLLLSQSFSLSPSLYPLPRLLLFPPLSIYHPHSFLPLPPPLFPVTLLSLHFSFSLSLRLCSLSFCFAFSFLISAPFGMYSREIGDGGLTEVRVYGGVCVCVCVNPPSITLLPSSVCFGDRTLGEGRSLKMTSHPSPLILSCPEQQEV